MTTTTDGGVRGWRRITGEGYDLEGTDYGVRWSYKAPSERQELDGYEVAAGREYAVIRLSDDENIEWFDRCADAKAFAEQLARRAK